MKLTGSEKSVEMPSKNNVVTLMGMERDQPSHHVCVVIVV